MPIPNSVPNGGVPQRPAGQRPQGSSTSEKRTGVPSRLPSVPPRPVRREEPSQRRAPVRTSSSEYDFDPNRIDRRRQTPVSNPYDAEGDDTFEPIPVDEQLTEDELEEQEIRREMERRRAARKSREAALEASQRTAQPDVPQRPEYVSEPPRDDYSTLTELPEEPDEPADYDYGEEEPQGGSDSAPAQQQDETTKGRKKPSRRKRNKKDKNGQDVFIDEKAGKVEAFGGKRSKRVKESDLDARKNRRKNAAIIQWIVIVLVLILVGLGVKNAVFPPDSLTEAEVATIAKTASGTTDFPTARGRAYASDFMKAYLTNGNADASKVLGYFYNGNLSDGGTNDNRNVSSSFIQNVEFGPTVYSEQVINDYSASFVIGALVSEHLDKATDAKSHWAFFNVNVYYDKATDRMYITPDSPTVVPETAVGSISDVPKSGKIGTGSPDDTLATEVKSVVYGFMKAYSESSPSDHTSLDQYLIGDPDPSLTTGLNKVYQFSGSIENAVTYTAYPVDGDPTTAKILVKATWSVPLANGDSSQSANYTSTYVMTLNKQSSKWLVSKFQPLLYVKDVEE